MEIDLNGLLDVARTLDDIVLDLAAAIPPVIVTASPEVVAALDRVQAAATAARLARSADLADLSDGMGRIRTMWVMAENTLAAVPR